jgi:DNA gyrase/topoisomerase IV subunit B
MPEENSGQPKSFNSFLGIIDEGRLHSDLSDELQELCQTMNRHCISYGGKKIKGKVSLTIDIVLEGGIFEVQGKHKITSPNAERGKTVMWSDKSNNFTPQNPRQMDIFQAKNITSIPKNSIKNV